MENNQPLVSMITYCYNGERFVGEYFEHILAQTYPNIELIFFDNGSTDRTGEIAEEYKIKLQARGVQANIIHYKENQCTCTLKQEAFQTMHGEYFFGCDSDDFIDPTYIEEMSGYLQSHPDKGIVYCQLRATEEETGKVLSIMKMEPRTQPKEAFMDLLFSRNINYTAISYMMSTKWLDVVNPDRIVYKTYFGENNQCQMPFLYHDLQGYIEKPLGQYTVRKDSYSGTLTTKKRIDSTIAHEEIIFALFDQLNIENRAYYEPLYLKSIRSTRFFISLHQKDKQLAKKCYAELKEVGGVTAKARIEWLLYNLNLLQLAKKILKK